MPNLLSLTGPIFALIGLGYLAVRLGWFDRALLPALARFVIAFCLPALLWRALSQRSPAEVVNAATLGYLLAYAAGSLTALGVGLWWGRRQGQTRDQAAMTGMGMSCSNTAFIGFPLCLQVVGPTASVALALCMVVENFLMIPLALALADSAADRHAPLRLAIGRAIWGLRMNPLVLGILAGLVTGALRSSLGFELPGVLTRAIDFLAGASTATSLFYIGGTLVGLGLGEGLRQQVSAVAVGKLVLHPLAVGAGLAAVSCMGAPVSVPLLWCGVLMAAAPMLGIYPILGARYGRQTVNAACMLVATVTSFASLGLVLKVLEGLLAAPR